MTDATVVIWGALQATPAEHAYECDQERLALEVGDRAADTLALDPELARLMTLMRLRHATPSETPERPDMSLEGN